MLHLSIDPNIVSLAKASNINLSNEFEQWLKIRLNQQDIKPQVDIELEKAKLKAELDRLNTLETEGREKKDEETLINDAVDHILNTEGYDDSNRIHGVQWIIKKRFGKTITEEQAVELIEKRQSVING